MSAMIMAQQWVVAGYSKAPAPVHAGCRGVEVIILWMKLLFAFWGVLLVLRRICRLVLTWKGEGERRLGLDLRS